MTRQLRICFVQITMKTALAAIFILSNSFFCCQSLKLDGNLVFDLTEQNFQDALDNSQSILVEFYAPWCGHCQRLAPEYEMAARMLDQKGSKIALAKVDATKEKNLAAKYGIRGYPTLFLFENGEKKAYTGGRTAETIVQWLEKNVKPEKSPKKDRSESFPLYDNVQDAWNFATKPQNGIVKVLGLFNENDKKVMKTFKSVHKRLGKNKKIQMAMANDQAILDRFNASKQSAIFITTEKFGSTLVRISDLGSDVETGIRNVIFSKFLPVVAKAKQAEYDQILQEDSSRSVLYFFTAKLEKQTEDNLNKICNEWKGKVQCVAVTSKDSDPKVAQALATPFGIKADEKLIVTK